MKRLLLGLLTITALELLVSGAVISNNHSTLAFAPSSCSIAFSQAPEYPTGSIPSGATIADIDGDGRQDLIVAYKGANGGFSVLRNLGSGQFAPKDDFTIPANVMAVESAFTYDIDSDGKPDVVLSSSLNNRIAIFRNISAGPGSVLFAPRSDRLTAGDGAKSVSFADFDGDGVADIAVGSQFSNSSVSIFRNLSVGTGTITLAPRVDFIVPSVSAITTADMDLDGKPDIVVGGSNPFNMRVLLNTSTGPGNFNFSISAGFTQLNQAYWVTAKDFDGDGKIDVAVTVSNNAKISVFRNTSTGPGNISFAARQDINGGVFAFGIVGDDFDGDGKIDIATGDDSGNAVSVYRNTSSAGNISFGARDWDFGTGLRPYNISSGDLNSDGKIDIITPNLDADSVSVLLNSGSVGNLDFISRRDYLNPSHAGVISVAAGDFDGDGKGDIAAAFDDSRHVIAFAIYRNNGVTEPFSFVLIPTPGLEPVSLAAADLDGDNKTDLAALTTTGVRVFRNTTVGSNFSFSTSYIEGGITSGEIRLVDLDGDGKQDLFVIFRTIFSTTQTAYIFLNTTSSPGNISFSLGTSFDVSSSTGYSFGDIDGDQKIDIAYYTFQSNGTNVVKLKRNTSTGPGQISFDSQDLVSSVGSLDSSVLVDLDNDGKSDLLSNHSQFVYSLRSISFPGNFMFGPIKTLDFQFMKPVDKGDFDLDGRQDALAVNATGFSYRVAVLRNISTGTDLNLEVADVEAIAGNSNIGGSTLPLVSDLDGDGKKDIVSGFNSSNGGAVSVLFNRSCLPTRRSPFDFDGDGKTDVSIFRPGPGEWWYSKSSDGGNAALQFGTSTDTIAAADYTGDGKADIAFFRPSTGFWYILRSEDFSFFSFPFGATGDFPVPADYDGDGKADAAVFRPSTNTWFISNSGGSGTTIATFGTAGDQPVPADYDGDGKADIAIFRPGPAEWWMQRSTSGLTAFQFGNSTDKTVVGDYTGDGKADVAFFRPSTGFWFILRSDDNSFFSFPFGASGDIPAPGDYDGDGKTDAAVFRPSSSTWYVQRSTAGTIIQQFGSAGDIPVPSEFVR